MIRLTNRNYTPWQHHPAHGRLSFCASGASGFHSTRQSGLSVTNPQLSWHRRAVSVCSRYPEFGVHEAGSPCTVHIRSSAHTRPGPMCQRCLSFTTPMLIPGCQPTQPLLRHIRPGLCVRHISGVQRTRGQVRYANGAFPSQRQC